MKNEGILCISGPLAGERITDPKATTSEGYRYHYFPHTDSSFFFFNLDVGDEEDAIRAMAYGYEQHCKAVAERNKLAVQAPVSEQAVDCSLMNKELQDSYTASFLRSCRTCIIPSPFGEPTPLTLSYGKCYKGYLNEAMEFIVYAGTVNGEPEKSMGRISNPICIVP